MGLGGHVSKADHVWADTVCRGEAEAGARAGEIGLAPAEDDGVEIDAVFVDQAELIEALRAEQAGSTLLIKGSRSAAMDKDVAALCDVSGEIH